MLKQVEKHAEWLGVSNTGKGPLKLRRVWSKLKAEVADLEKKYQASVSVQPSVNGYGIRIRK